tara:strand:+ start:2435 stop:2704 length:270 start_codon:yes stop_codon:yes gene_type:complete
MKSFKELALELSKLLEDKQKAYGESFNTAPKILQLLYPDGVKVEDYEQLLTITRILDKLNRIANNDKSEDPFQDIAGYCLLALKQRDRR